MRRAILVAVTVPRAPRGFRDASRSSSPAAASPVASSAVALVSRAVHLASGDAVFVKRLRPRGIADAGALAAFEREARIGEALARAGAAVPRFVEAGRDELGPYLVTAAVEGAPATEALASSGSWRARAQAAFAALESVHRAADERGPLAVVHHDVHLDNVLFAGGARSGELQAWIVDFGLASARPDVQGALPPDDAVFRGMLRYASPEAARGEASTESSDRFSLAAALLHRASGVDPRGGATAAPELLYRAGTEPLEAWRQSVQRSAQPELALLARALAPVLAFDAGDRRSGPAW